MDVRELTRSTFPFSFSIPLTSTSVTTESEKGKGKKERFNCWMLQIQWRLARTPLNASQQLGNLQRLVRKRFYANRYSTDKGQGKGTY